MPTAMITGATSGIGRATVLGLANQGFHVVIPARSEAKASKLLSEIETVGGTGSYLAIDLSDLDSVTEAARQFEEGGGTLDVLVNNAAAGPRRGLTPDGFELQFGVNHLAHFGLTHHLRRTFRPGTRIVNVTSSMYERAGGFDWDALRQPTKSFYGLREYAVSKLANILFTREFAQQQPDWRTYAVHPGWTDTPIVPGYVRPFVRRNMNTPEESARTVIWCATSPDLADVSGGYFSRMKRWDLNDVAMDDGLARELRNRSERWCGVAPQF